MKPVTLEILTAPHCGHCEELLAFWDSIKGEWPNVTMREVGVLTTEGQALVQKHFIFASPGIIINDELFGSGNFDKEEILKKLKVLSAV